MLVDDIDSNEEEPKIFSNCVDSKEETTVKREEVTLHTISLQALWGTENFQTMRMQIE